MAQGETLLIFGATGFIGKHLGRIAENSGLRLLRSSRDGQNADLACDLNDRDRVQSVIRSERPSHVVNLAGATSVAESWRDPASTAVENVRTTLHLLEAIENLAPNAHLLCASSAEVYGLAKDPTRPFKETDDPSPVNPYGASKLAMEVFCQQFTNARSSRIAILRLFNQIGPGQSSRFVVSAFARQIAEAELAGQTTLDLRVGNIEVARDFTDVRDTATAILRASLSEQTGVFNLCSESAVPLSDILEAMRTSTELTITPRPDPELARPVDQPVLFGSAAKLRTALNWQPSTSIQRTVADTIGWWRTELSGRKTT